MSLTSGTRLGSYQITGLIGVGGMGEVYRASDTKLGREVAIKTLPSELAKDPDRLSRFEREAKLLATLNHAHIAAIYGLHEHEGMQFLAMELVDGETLERKLKDARMPVEEALRLALQIAEALEAAHEKGVMHRDLKPANIMVSGDGQVKVLDFGLAKAFTADPKQTAVGHSPALSLAMTQQGLVLGTAGYMSPEQASGQATDQRADIWAFGVVLYEMLTGAPLFSGESVPHILADVLKTEPDWSRLPTNLHPRLNLLLERCLKKKVRDRYHSMADVRVDIEDILRDPQGATPAAAQPPVWRRAWPAAAALVIGTLLVGAYLESRGRPLPPALPEVAAPAVTRFVITPPPTAPLANLGGYDVAISPDGKRLAYFAESPANGSVALYVRELDGLDATLVAGTEVSNPGQGNMNPFFSPDGKSIGYWAPDRGVVRVAVDGSPPLKMLDTPSAVFLGASWTEDNTLVYSAGRHLERASAGGGSKPKALTPDANNQFVLSPVLLPGGRGVLFGVLKNNVESVAVLDLETGEQKTLIENGQNPNYASTGHIVFARGTTLMAAPFDAAELALTGEPVAVLQEVRHPNPTTAADYALSANGTLVYVPSGGDSVAREAIVWVDRKGNVIERAISDLVEAPRDPRLSPDGARLVLTTGSTSDGDLWSYDLRGRPPIPLAIPEDNRLPVWSPDGRQVAFLRLGGGAALAEILTIPGDGSALEPRSLRAEPLGGGPLLWSPAGELFFYINPNQPDIMVTAAAATGEVRKVVATEYAEFDAALSPNGRWLAYASNRSGRLEVWVQGYPDGVPVRVSANGGYEPHWSADGRELFYLQGDAMMAVAAQTEGEFSFAPPSQLFSGRYLSNPDPGVRSYDVAHDGRFLMIQPQGAGAASRASSIVVVQNWTEELKRRVPKK